MTNQMTNLEYCNQIGCYSKDVFGGEVGGYHIQQNPVELAQFLDFLTNRESQSQYGIYVFNYLEIGSASGGFIRVIHERVGFDAAVMIDDGACQLDMQPFNIADFDHRVSRYTLNSHDPKAKEILEKLGLKYDLIFIDGDHSEEGVIQDFNLVLPYANKNTIIAFHDIHAAQLAPGVAKAYATILADGKAREILNIQDKAAGYQLGIGVCQLA